MVSKLSFFLAMKIFVDLFRSLLRVLTVDPV